MGRRTPLDGFIGGFYKDDDRLWSQQDCVNYLPSVAEVNGTLTPTMLRTPPGLYPFVEAGEGRFRGTYNCEGKLFGVVGRTLYQYTAKQIAIPIGTIPGNGRVSFSHNQVTNGNQMLVVNGNAGYYYDTTTLELNRITDDGYPGAIVGDFQDGYLVQIEPGRRFAFHSELADASSYNTLDRFTSEGVPDLLVTLASNAGELFLFSERSYEKFRNTGAVTQPFRTTNQTYNYGCAARFGLTKADGTIFFLGHDGCIYRIQGNSYPVRVSTRPVEQAIRDLNWSQCYSFTWKDSGHEVAYFTFPGGYTFGYDIPAQQWHRRTSYGIDQWRANSMTYWGNSWYAGDAFLPRLWRVDWSYALEGDTEFVSELTTRVYSDARNPIQMPRLELQMDTGQQASVAPTPLFPVQPPSPTISGDAPDGYIGQVYSYTYTATGGTPPYTFRVLNGVLPKGIKLNSTTGEISGTFEDGVDQTFSVRVTDRNQLADELVDTITVGGLWWMLRTDTLAQSTVWYSGNPINWPASATRVPNGTPKEGIGAISIAPGVVIIPSASGGTVERIVDLDPTGGIGTTTITLPSFSGEIQTVSVFDDCTILNMKDSNFYYITRDNALTFTKIDIAGGYLLSKMARLSNRRWVAYRYLLSDTAMVYSDQETPTTWTVGTTISTPGIVGRFLPICNGDKVVVFAINTQSAYVSSDGVSYTLQNMGIGDNTKSLSNVRDAFFIDDLAVVVGEPASGGYNTLISKDGAASFKAYAIGSGASGTRCDYMGGTLVISMVATSASMTCAYVCNNIDENAEPVFTESVMPFTVTVGNSATVTLVKS